jgi:hypothetical protein
VFHQILLPGPQPTFLFAFILGDECIYYRIMEVL